MSRTPHLLGLSLTVLVATHALAQTPPDAGALQQQIERERTVKLPKKIAPEKPFPPAAMKPVAGTLVTVKQFNFAGNTLLSPEQLELALASFLNRPLDFKQLQAAAAAVANAYRAAGWVVRAYLPAQDIKDGIVTIQMVEAVFGGTQIEGQAKRVKARQILRGIQATQATGKPLNADALDRGLLLADDLPGVVVSGALQTGKVEGETDLALKWADEPLLAGDVTLDNTGSRSTGRERLAANLSVNSPFGLGDQLNTNLIATRGSDFLRLGYTLPVGAKGWRVGANASLMRYALVGPDFAALKIKGSSKNKGIEANYPLIRSRLKNLYLGLNVDQKQFDNLSLTATSSHYRVQNYSISLNGNVFDNFGGGGSSSGSLSLVNGSVNLGEVNSQEKAALNGHFNKLRYSLSRQQVLSSQVALYAALSGQVAPNDLDSSEKFYLGGAYGVRAYPSSEGGGSSGTLANLELRWRLPNNITLSSFYDHGQISNEDNSPSYSLKGVGIVAAWQASYGLNLKATWARRIGDNPNPTASGNDQDGSLINNRFWLTANQPF